MQILHPFAGSLQQYLDQLADLESPRPKGCPQCQANPPLTGHGFYTRTIIDAAFDGEIRVRRYLCQACRRTVSLLPEFALPYLRSSVTVMALWLLVRLRPAVARSRRPSRRTPARRRARWSLPTHHLSGRSGPLTLRLHSWMTKPKKPPCSVTDSSPRWCWKRSRAAS